MWRHSVELRSPPPYLRTRAEFVKTCRFPIRHNDRLGLLHQQSGRQRRQDGVCVTVGALTTWQSKSSISMALITPKLVRCVWTRTSVPYKLRNNDIVYRYTIEALGVLVSIKFWFLSLILTQEWLGIELQSCSLFIYRLPLEGFRCVGKCGTKKLDGE